MSRLEALLEDLLTLPGDAQLAHRQQGARGVWKAVAARSLHRVFRAGRLTVFAQLLGSEPEAALPAGMTITSATDQDWAALRPLVGERELSGFRDLFARGRHCLIAWRGRQPVGYAWVADRPGPDVTIWPLPFEFPERAAYLCKLYVLPAERRSGIGSALAQARLRLARERGFLEGWRMVAPSNVASLRTVRKSATSTHVVGEVRFVQLFSRTYSQFLPAVPSKTT
jgi:ribosomal protein S18 acetylase RimI-like enzyme